MTTIISKMAHPEGGQRHAATFAAACIAWVGATILVALRASEWIGQRWMGAAVLLVGVAIAASVSLTRMRLARTIEQVFDAGIMLSRKLDQIAPPKE